MSLPHVVLTCAGVGHLRPAPGTWGSLPPVLLALFLAPWALAPWLIDACLLGLLVLATAACLGWGNDAERHFRREDPPQVVADEVAGQSLALLALPWRADGDPACWWWNLLLAGTALLAFRVLDILKPPPIRSVQRLPGGLGIVLDDLLAGLGALALAQLAARWLWPALLPALAPAG